MEKPKYFPTNILSTKLGKTFTIVGIVEEDFGNGSKRLCYELQDHGYKQLPISYIDNADHLTCINRTKAGKLLWSK